MLDRPRPAREEKPPHGLTLRPMTAVDLDRVLEIEHAAFAMPWSSLTYRNLLARAEAEIWVAELPDAGIIGYTAFWTVLDESELGNIAVSPAWRRRGIARRLIEHALARAAARGAAAVFLEVRVSNHAALQLYEELGFVHVGMRRNYYAYPLEDALVMRRELRSRRG
ncbi:MAG: ribosomal protein S18-alanine N-acetyltransferase [Longimicrobiales bacterium]